MGWNKEGSTIKAEYCGTTFTGMVLESRVKYGGKVQHRVAAEPFYVEELKAVRSVVLIDEDEVLVDFGIIAEVE